MSDFNANKPIHWALRVASLLREDWQREWFRQAIPLLASAQWGAGLLDIRTGDPSPEELDSLVDSITESMDAIGILRPDRAAIFILADWERLQSVHLERVLLRLADRFPEAKVEALPLHQENSPNLELVLAAGRS